MAAHDFDISLQREQSMQNFADAFYIKCFGVTDIVRYNKNTDADMFFQRRDIDVSFVRNGKRVLISEKFRERDFNDLYIELYSKYPTNEGWMKNSEAQYITYFFPTRMFLIDKKTLEQFYTTHLQSAVPNDLIKCFCAKNVKKSNQKKLQIQIANEKCDAKLIQAYNKTNNAEWYTIGIAVSFDTLKKFEVYYKEFLF